jgi:hypothetical protein
MNHHTSTRRLMPMLLAFVVFVALAPSPARAQPGSEATQATARGTAATAKGSSTRIYRCGPQGREFSQAPCADGKGSAQEVAVDEPSAAQRAQAQRAAQSEATLAAQLRSERLAREAAAAQPLRAAGIRHQPALAPSTKAVASTRQGQAGKSEQRPRKKTDATGRSLTRPAESAAAGLRGQSPRR